MDDVFTLLANVTYQQNRWLPYVYNRKIFINPLYTSGLINQDPTLATYASSLGKTFTIPYFNPLTGTDQLFTSNSQVAVSNINTSSMEGTKNIRWTAWGWEDLAAAITGADPAQAIGDQVATWETNADMAAVGAILTGLFGTGGALMIPTHYQKFASEAAAGVVDPFAAGYVAGTPATTFTALNLFQALTNAMGEYADLFDVLGVHPNVYFQMVKADLIKPVATLLPSGVSVNIPKYLGKYTVINSASVGAVRAGTGAGAPPVYRSYAFKSGAIGYGQGLPPGLLAVESYRLPLEKKMSMVYMRGFVMHPYGLTYTGAACANEWPTNDEYANPANWQIAGGYLPKDMPFVAIDTN